MSRLCAEIDEKIAAFLDRPLEGDWPHLWLHASHAQSRTGGHIVSTAVALARQQRRPASEAEILSLFENVSGRIIA